MSYEIDEEVVIRAPFLANPTLVDEDVGDEPPVASPQENVDLEEVNDFPGHRSVPRTPTFDDNGFEEYKMDERYVSSRDNWILSLIGNANVKAGDYSKAMQSLLKVNARVNINTVEQSIKDSFPDRNYDELSDDQKQVHRFDLDML